MQKTVFESSVQLLRQCMSSSLNQVWNCQVRHGHARNLAIARGKLKKMEWYLKKPYLATSRILATEDVNSLDQVVESKDGRIVVCYHPEPPFPYEMTKPIPLDVTPTHSALKLQALVPVREIFRKKHKDMVLQELMQLTYTSKHRWGPMKRRDRLMKLDVKGLNTERDREYL